MLDIFLMYAFYSLPITLSKAALQYVQPLFLVSARMLLSAPFLLGYLYLFKRDQLKIARADWGLFLQVTFFSIYCAFVLIYWALPYMSSNKNAVFFTLTPFITAILCYFLYNEKMSIKKILGLTIGFVGSLPVLLGNSGSETQFCSFGLPELAALLSAAAFAYGWIVAGKLSNKGYSPSLINGVSMLLGGLLVLITSPFIDVWNPLPYTQFAPFIGYTLLMVFFANLIAYNWYVALLRKYSPTFIAFVGFTQPLYVALFSYFLLGEVITWQFFVSMAFIVLGLYLFYQEELSVKQPK